MSGQTVPGGARTQARGEAAPIVARPRRHAMARPFETSRLARTVAWIVVAIGLSAAIAALVAVLAVMSATGLLSASLAS